MKVVTVSQLTNSPTFLAPAPTGSVTVQVETRPNPHSTPPNQPVANLDQTEFTDVLKTIKNYSALGTDVFKVIQDNSGIRGNQLQGVINGTGVVLDVTNLVLSSASLVNSFQKDDATLAEKGKNVVAVTLKSAKLVQDINKMCPGLPVIGTAGQILDHVTLFLNVTNDVLDITNFVSKDA